MWNSGRLVWAGWWWQISKGHLAYPALSWSGIFSSFDWRIGLIGIQGRLTASVVKIKGTWKPSINLDDVLKDNSYHPFKTHEQFWFAQWLISDGRPVGQGRIRWILGLRRAKFTKRDSSSHVSRYPRSSGSIPLVHLVCYTIRTSTSEGWGLF